MTFFLDDKLGRRRIADIVSISAGRIAQHHGRERLMRDVEMANGERLLLLDVGVQDLLRSSIEVLSAEPGLMALVGEDEAGAPLLSPVLGWAITFGGAVRPITATGVNDDQDHDLPIVYPDGAVRYLGYNVYPSLEAYFKSHADQAPSS